MELILIRHGLPEHIETKDGTPADPPLAATGLDQASRVADWLKAEHIDRLYTSPMQRAVQTAAPIAEHFGHEPEVQHRVAEYDRDADHYVPVEKMKELDYERWKLLMSGEVDVAFDEFSREVIDALETIVGQNRGKRVAVTCHGGVINVWAAHVIGFTPKLFFNPNYTSINRFMAASSGEKSVITLNEHHHLNQTR